VFLLSKPIPIKIAKYFKIPQHDAMKYRSDLHSLKSIISGRQIAYKVASNYKTLVFYKKANLTVFYDIENVTYEWLAKSVVLPLSDKNDFVCYKRSSNVIIEPNFSGDYFRFLGINNELYEVVTRYQDDGEVLTLVNFVSGELILVKKVKGFLIASVPIYNNYIPIGIIKNKRIEVYLFDINNRKLSKILQYSMNFLEKELYKFLITVCNSDSEKTKKLIIQGRGSYRLHRSYDTCEDFIICKSFIHITNDTLTGHNDGIVFTIALTANKNVLNCELLIPEYASFKALDISEIYEKHIIDTKQMQFVPPDGDYTMPNIMYRDKKYVLAYDIMNTERYFIVSHDSTVKYLIDTTKDDMYKMYIVGKFMFIVFKTEGKRSWHWRYNILVYDTRRNIWLKEVIVVSAYSDIGIYGCYYIQKCEKVVFLVYNTKGHSNSFYKTDEERRAVNIEQAIVIELSRSLNSIRFRNLSLDAIIMEYMKNKHSSECSGLGVKNVDCSIDVNKGIMYITGINYKCDIPVVTLECDLCGSYEVREFGIQYPIVRSQDITLDRTRPIYISTKALKSKGFPKYLPVYLSIDFYDFITNKVANGDMIFSSGLELSVRDRYYNRMDAVLAKISELREAVSVALQDDIVMMYGIKYRNLKAIMIIYEMTITKTA
jgi:hypothetical protein